MTRLRELFPDGRVCVARRARLLSGGARLAPSLLEPPFAFRAESISSRKRRRRRRRAPRVRERDRAKPRLRLRVVKRVLATCVRARAVLTPTRTERHAPPTSSCCGGECAYVRVKSGPPIDSEQLRVGPDRPVSPFRPRDPPPRPPTLRVAALFSLPSLHVCFVCMHSQDERTPATRRAVLSRCVPFLLFRDIPLSIFYQTTYLDIRLSICRSSCSVPLCFT